MSRQETFKKIYENGIWNDSRSDIPKSGPGSSLVNTVKFREFFDTFCEANAVESVLDIGCGDLTWMPLTKTFQTKKYTGIDIVQSLIDSHSANYPQHTFFCLDAVAQDIPSADIICIRDVLFHLSIEDIQTLLKKVKCKYLVVTSCRNDVNNNAFNRCHYHTINLTKAPFNMSNFIESIYEPEFNRDVFIYQFLSQ
jgi:2-polyprenyl-3-methyl-5-hydroxy-6-metoxy-1,4-benzoquinol methylase